MKGLARYVPHLQLIAVNVMKTPTSLEAGERALSNGDCINYELCITAFGRVPESNLQMVYVWMTVRTEVEWDPTAVCRTYMTSLRCLQSSWVMMKGWFWTGMETRARRWGGKIRQLEVCSTIVPKQLRKYLLQKTFACTFDLNISTV